MTKLSKNILVFSMIIVSVLFADGALAEKKQDSDTFQETSKWKSYPLFSGREVPQVCQDVKKILDEPENKDFGKPYIKNSEFLIPEGYRNFTLPKWEDVKIDDIMKFMNSEQLEESEFYTVQRAYVDLNYDGTNEEIFKFRYGKKEESANLTYYYRLPGVSMTKMEGSYLFYYQDKIYTASDAISSITFFELHTPPQQSWYFYDPHTICSIVLVDPYNKLASKEFDKEFNRTNKSKSQKK